MRKTIIGVMGPGEKAREIDVKTAYQLGAMIAREGWVLLSGGRNMGVMDAVSKGAKSAGGLVLGIIPTKDLEGASDAVDIPIITGMGSARNNINVLTSDVIIACGMEAGTASEVSMAIKAKKKVILLNVTKESKTFFQIIGKDYINIANTAEEAINLTKDMLAR